MGAIREYLKIHPPDNTKHKPIYACVEFAQDSIISDIDRWSRVGSGTAICYTWCPSGIYYYWCPSGIYYVPQMAEGKTETTANRIYVAPPI